MIYEFKTILDLIKTFPDEKSCHQYLAQKRWNGYMTCPHVSCSNDKAYVFSDGIRYKCTGCRKIYKATTGTIFEASNISLVKWFLALYLTMHKKGISSIQLSKDIGVTQKTSWFLLQRIRATLGNEKKQILEGTVLLDETFCGGKNKNRHADKKVKNSHGRSFKDKTPVMGMLQQQEFTTLSRPHKVIPSRTVNEKVITKESTVQCHVVPDTKAKSIQPILKASIKAGTTIVSDEWSAYTGMGNFYDHHIVDHSRKEYVNELGYSTNALEGFWTQAKRSIIGIYHKTSRKHLNKYFNEFTFRFNYRNFAVQKQFDFFIDNMEIRLKYKNLIA